MTENQYRKAIWWVKRDFRLEDNEALLYAVENSEEVIALFVYEPALIQAPETSHFHIEAWRQACACLGDTIAECGSILLQIHDDILKTFSMLKKIYNFELIVSHQETGSNITYQRDLSVKKWSRENQVDWKECTQNSVVRNLKNRDERPFFWKQRIEKAPYARPQKIRLKDTSHASLQRFSHFDSHSMLGKKNSDVLVVSEKSAHQVMSSFLEERSKRYSGGISSPNKAFRFGSRLSHHLAWGTVSIRAIWWALQLKKKSLQNTTSRQHRYWLRSLDSFSSRLFWHDHFIQRLETQPRMEFAPLHTAYLDLPYRSDTERLEAWLQGYTGVPLVDACMRCLQATGFLNFRMRSMVVSYAMHVLHLSWQDIMYPLAQLFLDYEPGIHISQLQMQAGVVGINTLRVYNPHKQLIDHDPYLIFVKHWVPELRGTRNVDILAYTDLGRFGYLSPFVDYKSASNEMKQAYYAIKKSTQAQQIAREVLKTHGSRKRVLRKKLVKEKKANVKQLPLFGLE